jgi:hypothetical protein
VSRAILILHFQLSVTSFIMRPSSYLVLGKSDQFSGFFYIFFIHSNLSIHVLT